MFMSVSNVLSSIMSRLPSISRAKNRPARPTSACWRWPSTPLSSKITKRPFKSTSRCVRHTHIQIRAQPGMYLFWLWICKFDRASVAGGWLVLGEFAVEVQCQGLLFPCGSVPSRRRSAERSARVGKVCPAISSIPGFARVQIGEGQCLVNIFIDCQLQHSIADSKLGLVFLHSRTDAERALGGTKYRRFHRCRQGLRQHLTARPVVHDHVAPN